MPWPVPMATSIPKSAPVDLYNLCLVHALAGSRDGCSQETGKAWAPIARTVLAGGWGRLCWDSAADVAPSAHAGTAAVGSRADWELQVPRAPGTVAPGRRASLSHCVQSPRHLQLPACCPWLRGICMCRCGHVCCTVPTHLSEALPS